MIVPTTRPTQRTEFRASFFVSRLLLFYLKLIISRSPPFLGVLPSDPSRPLAPEHSRPRLSPIATMPSSLYVPILITGMLLTVRSSPLVPAYTLCSLSPGLQQLALEQVAGPWSPSLYHTCTLMLHQHRTCNVSRTAMTLILRSGCSTSSQSGKPSRCSVRDPLCSAPLRTRSSHRHCPL